MGLFSNAKKNMDARLAKYEVTDEMLYQFMGPRAGHYIAARDKKTMWGWHWPAFFVTVPWLAYRKQFMIVLVFIILYVLPFFLPHMIGIACDIFWLAIFTHGRYFYYFWAYRTIGQINLHIADPAERQKHYADRGGVSPLWSVIGLVFMISLFWFAIMHVHAIAAAVVMTQTMS